MDLGLSFVDVDLKYVQKEQKKQKKRERKERKRLKAAQRRHVMDTPRDEGLSSQSSGSQNLQQAMGEDTPDIQHDERVDKVPQVMRDTWMTEKTQRNILTGKLAEQEQAVVQTDEEARKPKEKQLQPGLHGGKAAATVPSGDGGASWRLKALKRAEAQAASEGRDLQSVVSERFGSLKALTDTMSGQGTAHPKAHLHASQDRLRQRDGGEAAEYLLDLASKKMRKPNSSATLSWRRKVGTPPGKGNSELGQTGSKPKAEAQVPSEVRRVANAPHRATGTDDTATRARAGEPSREERSEQPFSPNLGALKETGDRQLSRNRFKNDGSLLETSLKATPHSELQADAQIMGQINIAEKPGDTPQGTADLADGDNRSAAAALRARLLGKGAGAMALGKPAANAAADNKRRIEVLPSVDAEGRAMPGAFGRSAAGDGQVDGGRKPKKLQRYKDGEKQVYFAGDDKQSLDDLVREQRHGSGQDIDANLAENISRKSKFRERDLDVDDEYEVDGGIDMYESRNKKLSKEKAVKRQRASQIADLRMSNRAQDSCSLCFGSPRMKKHLTIALGQTAYLSIPERGRLAPLHCCIAPLEHIASCRKIDEHVWTEMRNFKKCILQMFMAEGLDAVFLETAMRLVDRRSHAIVHAVPLDAAAFQRAPLVFRKALVEAESEWSQHHAKAVIDTRAKGLRGSIPPNFPYFFVEFGLSAGFVHVIDDEEKFEKDFGRSILAGLLGHGAESQHRGAKAEPEHVVKQLQSDFASKFDPFDWTKQLE